MKNLITLEDLQKIKPVKPKLFWLRALGLSMLPTILITVAIGTFLYFMLIRPCYETYMDATQLLWPILICLVLLSYNAVWKQGFLFGHGWFGLKQYYQDKAKFDEGWGEYREQQEYLELKKKYED